MKILPSHDQRGVGALAIVVVVVVLAAAGFVGWKVIDNNKDKGAGSVTDVAKQIAANCDLDDKDLCKFFSSWKENKYYKVQLESVNEGKKSTGTIYAEGTDKSHIVTTGDGVAYEAISIGNTTYIKDNSDGKWWKQTYKASETNETPTSNYDFKEPSDDKPAEQQTTYKKLGTEACDGLTCFKYQVVDPANTDTTEYIWFDTKDYQLRRTRTESKNGDYSDSKLSYAKVTIKEPSPVKEMSTQTPSAEEIQRLMQQYGGGQ